MFFLVDPSQPLEKLQFLNSLEVSHKYLGFGKFCILGLIILTNIYSL